MPDDQAPVVDATPTEAAAEAPAAPIIQEDTNVPVGLMIDNNEQFAADNAPAEEAPQEEAAPSEDLEAAFDDGEAPAVPAAEEVPEAPEAPAAVLPEDPGEFQPKDYSFDITLADGTVVHIGSPEDIDKLGADIEFATPADWLKAQANFNKMVTGLENEQLAHDEAKLKYEAESQAIASQEQFISGVESGMNYLESKKYLPPVPPQYVNADWNDPEVAEQPGVKERVELINYMVEENKRRATAGVPAISSVLDAFNSMQLDAGRQQQVAQKKADGVARKARGAMVGGGTSASQGSNVPDNMIVGTGGSISSLTGGYL